jgi:hypothetical protein
MISKAKSIKGSVASVSYILKDKGEAYELARQGIASEKPGEIMKEFRMMQECNTRCENNMVSMVISPSSEKKFTNTELQTILQQHLKHLKLEKNQYLATVHMSTGKPHIHVLVNRIDYEGKATPDKFISKNSQEMSERIAKEYGLLTAKDWEKINEKTLSPVKEEIKSAHQFAKNNSRSYEQYKELMQNRGVKVVDTINKSGELQGFKVTHKSSDLTFKASKVGKNIGVKDLIENKVSFTQPLSPPYVKIVKSIIEQTIKISQGRGMGY